LKLQVVQILAVGFFQPRSEGNAMPKAMAPTSMALPQTPIMGRSVSATRRAGDAFAMGHSTAEDKAQVRWVRQVRTEGRVRHTLTKGFDLMPD